MALTESGISAIKTQKDIYKKIILDYYTAAKLTILALREDPEFGKYLADTQRGRDLMTELQKLLDKVDDMNGKTIEFTDVSIGDFIRKQIRLNEGN